MEPEFDNVDEIVDILSTVSQDIKAVRDRLESGEDVQDELDRLEAEKAELEAKAAEMGVVVDDPAAEPDIADLFTMAVKGIEERATKVEDGTKSVLIKLLKDRGYEGDDVEDVVDGILAEKSARRGSRYVGQRAEESFVKHVAGGGTYRKAAPGRDIKVGENRGVKALRESGSIATAMGAIWRVKMGVAEEHEELWVKEMGRKALAAGTDSAGGYLIPQEWMPDILGILRSMAVVRSANPRMVPMNKQVNQTSISTGATAYYTAENARISPSEQSFAEAILLTPKNLTGLVPVSNYLLADAPEAEEIVRQDLAEVLALREDLAFIRGDGSGNSPTGFLSMTGRTQNPLGSFTNGFQVTFEQTRRMKAVMRNLDARNPRLAWFFAPQFLTHLETLTDSTGRLLLDSNLLSINADNASGTLDGVPFFTTTQIPVNLTTGNRSDTTELYLVNMNECVVGINSELTLDMSSEASYTSDGGTTWHSAFQQNQTLFRAVIRHDINHRRKSQVITQTGVIVA